MAGQIRLAGVWQGMVSPRTVHRSADMAQKTQCIKCTENQFNRFTVGDMIGIQHDTAWWALWAGWRIAG